jgi:large subunit ribosomal protein L30
MAASNTMKVTLIRSAIGSTERQRATLRALGLTRRGKTVAVQDTPEARGRLRKVAHLVGVES